MSPSDDRVTVIEIALAHQQRAVEEMSDLIRQQAEQIDRLTRTLRAGGTPPDDGPSRRKRPARG